MAELIHRDRIVRYFRIHPAEYERIPIGALRGMDYRIAQDWVRNPQT